MTIFLVVSFSDLTITSTQSSSILMELVRYQAKKMADETVKVMLRPYILNAVNNLTLQRTSTDGETFHDKDGDVGENCRVQDSGIRLVDNHERCQTFVVDYSRNSFLQSLILDEEEYTPGEGTVAFTTKDESKDDVNNERFTRLDSRLWERPMWMWTNLERQLVAGHVAATDLAQSMIQMLDDCKDVSTNVKLKLLVSNCDCPYHIYDLPTQSCRSTNPQLSILLMETRNNSQQYQNSATPHAKYGDELERQQSISHYYLLEAPGDNESAALITPTKVVGSEQSKSPALTSIAKKRQSTEHHLITQSPASSYISLDAATQDNSDVTVNKKSTKPPQIDSTGLDLTTLSELPPRIRSEIRAAQALHERQRRKKRQRDSSFLGSWLSSKSGPKQSHTKTHNNDKLKILSNKATSQQSSSKQRQKKRDIVDYFGNKNNA
jgi:hypothetical protein